MVTRFMFIRSNLRNLTLNIRYSAANRISNLVNYGSMKYQHNQNFHPEFLFEHWWFDWKYNVLENECNITNDGYESNMKEEYATLFINLLRIRAEFDDNWRSYEGLLYCAHNRIFRWKVLKRMMKTHYIWLYSRDKR